MSGQDTALFASPAEVYAARVDAWWAAHVWLGRYRCPVCGLSERTQFLFTLNHDQPPGSPWLAESARPGRFCSTRHLTTVQALWGLKQDDPHLWADASMRLRKMAAALQGARR